MKYILCVRPTKTILPGSEFEIEFKTRSALLLEKLVWEKAGTYCRIATECSLLSSKDEFIDEPDEPIRIPVPAKRGPRFKYDRE